MTRLALGVAMVIGAVVGSGLSETADQFRFPIAWWGIVLALDGAVRLRHGSSPFARSRPLLVCAAASVLFWDLFELLNLRLHDWWYVGVPRSALGGAAFSAICYATVLPAVRLALALVAPQPGAELIAADADRRSVRWLLAAGTVALAAAGAAPQVAFPLAWVFLWPLCESALARRPDAEPRLASPLQGLRSGRRRLALRPLAVALPFGLAWESLNWGCARGWVYTVPYFEKPKLFEMPLPGYLGYLPFLLECAAALALLDRMRLRRTSGILALAAIAAFHLAVDRMGRSLTDLSVAPVIEDVASLAPAERARLEGRGLRTPRAILRASGVPDRLRRLSELSEVAHLGFFWAERLQDAGIPDRRALAAGDAKGLRSRLHAAGSAPSEAVLRLWVSNAARDPR